jgi:hypothetical protein
MAERESFSSVAAAWAQVATALVGVVAAVAATVVGIQSNAQGERQNDQAKTQQALEFFATFNAPDMLDVRRNLSNEDWCARYGYITAAQYEEEHGKRYETMVSQEQVLVAVDFFDTLNSCKNGGLCNGDFVDQLFGPYAREFYDDLGKAISDIRSGSAGRGATFGQGMAALADDSAPLTEVVALYQQSCGG